jgi:tRNA threonylcarbamoyl adenosine modification protein YjeE
MDPIWALDLPDEAATARLGEALALMLRPGDLVALHGDLGAGKSTLARAVLRSFSGRPSLDVPSPTFMLVQPYEGDGFRFPILHADLYRIADPAEIDELGLDEARATGAVLVEWPERAAERLAGPRIEVALDVAGSGRKASLTTDDPALRRRLARTAALRAFLDGTPWASARRTFLQGDASPRAYERLFSEAGASAILLNADAQPDRPVTPQRRAYMAATHLAPNDDVAPLLAVSAELAKRGFSVPQVVAADPARSIVLMQDLGRDYIAADGTPVPERYAVATDVLAAMHGQAWPAVAEGPHGTRHALPRYDRGALEVETALFLERFLPAATGAPASARAVEAFRTAWDGPFAAFEAAPATWTLLDYHSPNLHWLPDRQGLGRIGIIDVQDARLGPAAYDVASLLQDARVTVPPALEAELMARYLAARRAEPTFDPEAFAAVYAICAAQRATRILGVFARLAVEDGKPAYLRHIPRLLDYLKRALSHPVLAPVKEWYDAHAPEHVLTSFAERGGKGP